MSNIEYCALDQSDYDDLSALLADVWYAEADEAVRVLYGRAYLFLCLQRATFGAVAREDGRTVGLALARCDASPLPVQRGYAQLLDDAFQQIAAVSDEAAEALRDSFAAEAAIDRMLLAQSECDPDHELVLFAVDASTRGKGVGRALIAQAEGYLASQGAQNMFLFTDTTCTWEFYEHRGMARRAEWARPDNDTRPLPDEMFLYEGALS